jgi:hypothetical protein
MLAMPRLLRPDVCAPKLDRPGWRDGIAFKAFGCHAVVTRYRAGAGWRPRRLCRGKALRELLTARAGASAPAREAGRALRRVA